MTATRIEKLRAVAWLGVLFAAMLAVGAGQWFAGILLPLPVRLAIASTAAVAGAWLTLRYWSRIDEAAQEAQKSAWLWGGGLGMGVGWAADMVLSLPRFAGLLRGAIPHLGGALVLGGGLVALGAVGGFSIAWATWWAAKR